MYDINSASDEGKAFLSSGQKNPNDDSNYYVIDIESLNRYLNSPIKSLNYGECNFPCSASYSGTYWKNGSNNYSNFKGHNLPANNPTDVYIVNGQSKTVYYVKGTEYENNSGVESTYYRLSENYTNVPEIKSYH